MTCLALFLFQLLVNLTLVFCVDHQGLLTWEEMGVSFRDVFLFPERLQFNLVTTNIGSHFFYWVGTHFFSPLPLFYGRIWKAVFLASLAPLVFKVGHEKLKIGRKEALLAAILVPLLPGIFNYVWLSTEFGIESVFGLAAVLFALRAERSSELIAIFLTGFAALVYGSGLIFLPVVLVIIARNSLFSPRGKDWVWVSFYLAVFAVTVTSPLLWWHNHARVLRGGGGITPLNELLPHVGLFFKEMLYRSSSYYSFSNYAALSSALVGVIVLYGMFVSVRDRRRALDWAWVHVGWLSGFVLYVMSGREPGVRRSIPVVLFSMLYFGLGMEKLIRVRPILKALAIVVLVFASVQYSKVAVRYWTGRYELPMDQKFTIVPPATTMEQTFTWLLTNPKSAVDPTQYSVPTVAPALYLIGMHQATPPSDPFFNRRAVLDAIHVEQP